MDLFDLYLNALTDGKTMVYPPDMPSNANKLEKSLQGRKMQFEAMAQSEKEMRMIIEAKRREENEILEMHNAANRGDLAAGDYERGFTYNVVLVNSNDETFNIGEDPSTYVIVDDDVYTFNITFGGLYRVEFANYFDVTNYFGCFLSAGIVSNLSGDKDLIFVGDTLTLSGDNGQFYTLTFFTTAA